MEERIDHMKYLPDMEQIDSDIPDRVIAEMNGYDPSIYTENDVRRALEHDEKTVDDFKALLSPAALPLLEEIAEAARAETKKHFGNSVNMFTPLYISNYCENYCIYCGFNCHNKIHRAKLNAEEIEHEMQAIAKTGLQEILILTGERHLFQERTPARRRRGDRGRPHRSRQMHPARYPERRSQILRHAAPGGDLHERNLGRHHHRRLRRDGRHLARTGRAAASGRGSQRLTQILQRYLNVNRKKPRSSEVAE